MLSFAAGFLTKVSIDVFVGTIVGVAFGWRGVSTSDLLLLFTNAVSLVSVCLTTFSRSANIFVTWVSNNFVAATVFASTSYLAHEYETETIELVESLYTNFYVYVYRHIVESYGWLVRVIYEMWMPVFNLFFFLNKKFMVNDLADNFATCQSDTFGMTVYFDIATTATKATGEALRSMSQWLMQWTTEPLDLTAALSELQNIPEKIMDVMPCSCSALTRPVSSVARILSTKTLVNLIDSALNVPIRAVQTMFYGTNLLGVQNLANTLRDTLTHLGILADDVFEELASQLAPTGFLRIPRPFIFGLLSQMAIVGVEIGQLGGETILHVVSNPTSTPPLNIEPVFASMHLVATNSGGPLETLIDFAYNDVPRTKKPLVARTYCPLFQFDRSANLKSKMCACQNDCGSEGQCSNGVMCVPYYENLGLTVHGIPGQSHTPLIKKCTEAEDCTNGNCNINDGRCVCNTGFVINWHDGKCYLPTSNVTGLCQDNDCSRALISHGLQNQCLSVEQEEVDATVGNPFSCTVSSGLEAAVGAAYVITALSKSILLDPLTLLNVNDLTDKTNEYMGGISYRPDLSCSFRSNHASQTNSKLQCDCENSPYCNAPTVTHNVIWPLRKVAFYVGIGATESMSSIQDYMGLFITSALTMGIDGAQAILFTGLNLGQTISNTQNNAFTRPFDLATTPKTSTLCDDAEHNYLCEGTNNNCIAWWYDGNDASVRETFYKEQVHWCGSLIAEPMLLRAEHVVQSVANFLERLSSGSMRRQLTCDQTQTNFDTDSLMYINTLFDVNGNQFGQGNFQLFAPGDRQWCRTIWHPQKFACDVAMTVNEAAQLYSNTIRQLWRNSFAILFLRNTNPIDLDVNNRICNAYQVVNSAAGAVGNTIGQLTRGKLSKRVSHVISTSTEMFYGPVALNIMFVSEQFQKLTSKGAFRLTRTLDDAVIGTIVLVSRYVYVTTAKGIQLLQIVAYGKADSDTGPRFVRDLYGIINSFAQFFDEHGVEIAKTVMQGVAGLFEILQGRGIGTFIKAIKQLFDYSIQVIKALFSEFWDWFKKVLGPVGEMLDFVQDTLCKALRNIGKIIRHVRDALDLTGHIGTLFDNKATKSVMGFLSKPFSAAANALGVSDELEDIGRGLGYAGELLSMAVSPIDSAIKSIENLKCDFDSDGSNLNGANARPATAPPTPRPESIVVHRRRRRRAVRRRLVENTTTTLDAYRQLQSVFDWSGTTVCAKIGQVDTPPQTPFEIAMWSSCLEYRMRAAAISTVLEVPGNIFDDWYSVAHWSATMIAGSWQLWTSNVTIEQLKEAGYPGTAIMQVHRGLGVFADRFVEEFSMDDALDRTFAGIDVNTSTLKNIVHNLPVISAPSLEDGHAFIQHVTTGADEIVNEVRTAMASVPDTAIFEAVPRRRLLLFEKNFAGEKISIARGDAVYTEVFNLARNMDLTTCPVLMQTLDTIKSVLLATANHYTKMVPTTLEEFFVVMKSQRYDDSPLLNWKKRDISRRMPPPVIASLQDSFPTLNPNKVESDMNWPQLSPKKAANAIIDFVKLPKTERTLTIPVFEKPLWEWIMSITSKCDYENMLYNACDDPKASMAHTKRMMLRVTGLAAGAIYVLPSPFASAIVMASPLTLAYVFLHTRYEWTPFCAPTLPVCLARDVQILFKDTMSIDRCFCQTRFGQALLKPEHRSRCTVCLYYQTNNPEVSYDKCPSRTIPTPLWAPLRATAWLFPEVFNVVFRSSYSPVRFLATSEVLRMGADISAIDEACIYVHMWDVALTMTGIPLLVSLSMFAYGQALQISMQIMLWLSTLVCILKPEKNSEASAVQPPPPPQQSVENEVMIAMEPNTTSLRQRHQRNHDSNRSGLDVP